MTRAKKLKPGRPSLGKDARTKVVTIKLSEHEYAAIEKAVAKGTSATVSSWIRDHALDPLGLARLEDES